MSRYWKKIVESPVGKLELIFSRKGVAFVLWEKEKAGRVRLPKEFTRDEEPSFVAEAVQQLAQYFRRERKTFDLPLDPQGSPFQLKVWSSLREIPYGETNSYQEQARRLGDARKARAVGAANGRNPLSIFLPCHRVVGKSGKLTGFAGGLAIKKKLLELERAPAI